MLHLVTALVSASFLLVCLYLIGAMLSHNAVRIIDALLPSAAATGSQYMHIRASSARCDNCAKAYARRRQPRLIMPDLDTQGHFDLNMFHYSLTRAGAAEYTDQRVKRQLVSLAADAWRQ